MSDDVNFMKFTTSFCQSVREGPIRNCVLVPIGRFLRDNPNSGQTTISGSSIVRYWDFNVPSIGNFRWHYLFLAEDFLIVSILVVPRGGAGFDVLSELAFVAKLTELVLGLFELV